MAGTNLDYASGLQPVYSANGESPPTVRYPLQQGIQTTKYSGLIYRGQCVRMAATGWIRPIATVASHVAVIGVAAEPYMGSAASTQTDLAVWPMMRGQKWQIQLNNTVATTNLASFINKNADLTAVDEGNTNSGVSIMELAAGSLTSASQQFRILDTQIRSGGRELGANTKVVVEPNWAGTAFTLWDDVATGT